MFKQNTADSLTVREITTLTLSNADGILVVQPMTTVAAFYHIDRIIVINVDGRELDLPYDDPSALEADWQMLEDILMAAGLYRGIAPWKNGEGTNDRSLLLLDGRTLIRAAIFNTNVGDGQYGVHVTGDKYEYSTSYPSEAASNLLDTITDVIWKYHRL